ncbi:lanthionine synthetase LanC family protein [Chryseobacterium oranimense]|uniref:lanthionine synthetase LanC family protein n=1 Tax=Chryseobacterium oranimense TaxID=421058 RepID=UPI0031DD02C7
MLSLQKIYSHLINLSNFENWDAGLNGRSAVSLFFFHYYKLNNNVSAYNKGIELIEYELNNLENITNISLFNGLSGIAWVTNHLSDQKLLDLDHDTFLPSLLENQFQDFFFSKGSIISEEHFELNCGILFYFIERFSTTKSNALKKNYEIFINQGLILFTHFFYQINDNDYSKNISLMSLELFLKILNVLKEIFPSPFLDFLITKTIEWVLKNNDLSSHKSVTKHIFKAAIYLNDNKLLKKVNILKKSKNTSISADLEYNIGIWNSGYSRQGIKLIIEKADFTKNSLQYLLE